MIAGLMMPIFVIALAMAIDLGFWRQRQVVLQNACDMAAISMAMDLENHTSLINAQRNAMVELQANNMGNAVTVTMNSPPLSGPNTSNVNAVEIILSSSEPQFFSQMIKSTSETIQIRTVAAGTGTKGGVVTILE